MATPRLLKVVAGTTTLIDTGSWPTAVGPSHALRRFSDYKQDHVEDRSCSRVCPLSLSHPIKRPLDLPNSLVGPGISECADYDSQVIVESPKPAFGDFVRLEVGPGDAGEPALGVYQDSELAVDQDVVLGSGFGLGCLARIGIAPGPRTIPMLPGHRKLTGDLIGIALAIESKVGGAIDLLPAGGVIRGREVPIER